MAKSECRTPAKGRPVLNPRGVTRRNRATRTLNVRAKSQKYAQGIVHKRSKRGHKIVLDTGDQQSMVGMGVKDIIQRHDT